MGNASLNPPFFWIGTDFRTLAYYNCNCCSCCSCCLEKEEENKVSTPSTTTTPTTTPTITHHANPRKPRHPRRKHNLSHPLLDLRQPPRLRPSIHAASLRRRRLDHGTCPITLHSLSHRATRRNRTRHRSTSDRSKPGRRDSRLEILVFL